ncbi:hypothetical protein NBT05_17260 [Aquimarina sp. ERC-38]|uniref:hypothetical protein n=1 Tax=Aquimarina sp. ERC-38 TaxID=2949996 RepID=UPI0022473BEE|nr:hypothetical protein [Aquimarina sp. ERC-38]UZO80677.1 hypothetical protein NBT05_17260 [Aquimarina sp. ERC-38]
MIRSIRENKITKVIASYLVIQMLVQLVQPAALWALTGGPSQPEFNSFTPIGTSDMVDLASGDFNYNIPIMDVGGYPLNLAYDSGVTMDQEASWVGLGWNLNVGQINRQVRGLPDDFKGDELTYENYMRPNVTVGVDAKVDFQLFGFETIDGVKEKVDTIKVGKASLGANLKYNNYTGISFTPSFGVSFDLANTVSVGVDYQLSATEGITVAPNVGINATSNKINDGFVLGSLNAGVSYNSRAGLTNFNLSAGLRYSKSKERNFDSQSPTSYSFNTPSLTPRKRTAFTNNNGTVAVSLGGDIFGADVEGEISATGSVQKIKQVERPEKGYGYDYTGFATPNDIKDYNREKDNGVINRNTLSLPIANYTYDLYTVQGQGIGGMFRPYRSQVGQINDDLVEDESASETFGVEIEPGTGFHYGANYTNAPSVSRTGVWDTRALKSFKQNREDQKASDEQKDYEPVYYKFIGEPTRDRDQELFENLGGYNPIALKIGGSKNSFNKYAKNQFRIKENSSNGIKYNSLPTFDNKKFKRKNRNLRNQNVQKFTVEEVRGLYNSAEYLSTQINEFSKPHHTAEIRIQKDDGSTYVFGKTAYNKLKQEVTFTTNSKTFNCADGTVVYRPGENSPSNRSGIDNFYDAISTPEYAHTYLLSAVFSADYEDVKGDGPTDDDLGSYTKFNYERKNANYKWRVPFNRNHASYNPGLNTDKTDQKGSYIYGEKELVYIKSIETKTHVAIFDLSERNDAVGVSGINGGASNTDRMYKIEKIRLYSKPEAIAANLLDDDSKNDKPVSAIKIAHFTYDYSLAKGTPNSTAATKGKLTLKSVYFTYRNSNMGKYTPYTFNYDGFNPNYNLKSYNIWGGYKPNSGTGCGTLDPITVAEFPYVEQTNRQQEDEYAGAWLLASINLPSGGTIEMDYESDDYNSVQDRSPLRMFKVAGVGKEESTFDPEANQKLYESGRFNLAKKDPEYLYIKLPEETVISNNTFRRKYLKGIEDKPIYFRFLLNMQKDAVSNIRSSNYDYVTGYFNLSKESEVNIFSANQGVYAAIPMQMSDLEGGIAGSKNVNPISKAGWYFGRRYMPSLTYGLNNDYRSEDIESIAKKIISSFQATKEILTGPNGRLRSNEFLCAQRFIPDKSWIRLSNPKTFKIGGGSRVSKLVMNDEWGKMLNTTSTVNNSKYNKSYGQTYQYNNEDGSSNGVAVFEPAMSKENPFVEPFYNKSEHLVAPKEVNYVEKPFGESFFPQARVTYSKVTVKNLQRDGIKRHATGKVVTSFYTSKDYPTLVDYTDIDSPNNYATDQDQFLRKLITGLFGGEVKTRNEYALSQGFMVHTNDMNGKMRSQEVYAEDANTLISGVHYKYNTDLTNSDKLDNKVPLIDKNGEILYNDHIGVDYEVVTDFRESYSQSKTQGYKVNVVTIVFGIIPVIIPTTVPSRTSIENVAYTTTTTKAIHTSGILKEKIAYDLGSKVSTINEAWDANTGKVLLTRTVNEFDDEYFNLEFPAYWRYTEMGLASQSTGINGILKPQGKYFNYTEASKYLIPGDEIIGTYNDKENRYWIAGIRGDDEVLLMDKDGGVVNVTEGVSINKDIKFKVVRSGNRNQQMSTMSSITMMQNPLKSLTGANNDHIASGLLESNTSENIKNHRLVNASAVSYKEFWNCQCENLFPFVPEALSSQGIENVGADNYPFEPLLNPYVYNIKGEWRADKSYTYLTDRGNDNSKKVNTRVEGFFNNFTPYYNKNTNNEWEDSKEKDQWTFASEVTQYNAQGVEIENRDALNRYSSAQYGYNYTLPNAVVSNSRYRDMGMDSFEDYNYIRSDSAHFNFKSAVDRDGIGNVRLSDQQAHSGKYSLLIPAGEKAELERNLIGEQPVDNDSDNDGISDTVDLCPYIPSTQRDYDGDGIGDECDDDAVPTISGRYTTNDTHIFYDEEGREIKSCVGRAAEIRINGSPNDTIQYGIVLQKTNYRGMALRKGSKVFLRGDDVRDRQGDQFVFNDIVLDETGNAIFNLDMDVVRARSKRPNNTWEIEFRLLHKQNSRVIKGTRFKLKSLGQRIKSCNRSIPVWDNLDKITY